MRATVWLDLVAAALAAEDPAAVDTMVATTLATATRADLAAHVALSSADPNWIMRSAAGDRLPVERDRWPDAAAVRRHPLHAFYADTGHTGVTVLRDVMRRGWPMDDAGMQLIRELDLSLEQVSLVVGADRGAYDGWVLFTERPCPEDELRELERVRQVLSGLARHCRLLQSARSVVPAAAELTPREKVVLYLISQGRTVEGIAARLAISPRTVHKHQEHLYRKLGAADRLSAVLAAQRQGLLPGL